MTGRRRSFDDLEFETAMADYARSMFWTRVIGAARAFVVAALGVGMMAALAAWGWGR